MKLLCGLTFFAGHLPGTYDLRLNVPGYAEWTKPGVVVLAHQSGCGAQVTTVNAAVERLPQG